MTSTNKLNFTFGWECMCNLGVCVRIREGRKHLQFEIEQELRQLGNTMAFLGRLVVPFLCAVSDIMQHSCDLRDGLPLSHKKGVRLCIVAMWNAAVLRIHANVFLFGVSNTPYHLSVLTSRDSFDVEQVRSTFDPWLDPKLNLLLRLLRMGAFLNEPGMWENQWERTRRFYPWRKPRA